MSRSRCFVVSPFNCYDETSVNIKRVKQKTPGKKAKQKKCVTLKRTCEGIFVHMVTAPGCTWFKKGQPHWGNGSPLVHGDSKGLFWLLLEWAYWQPCNQHQSTYINSGFPLVYYRPGGLPGYALLVIYTFVNKQSSKIKLIESDCNYDNKTI